MAAGQEPAREVRVRLGKLETLQELRRLRQQLAERADLVGGTRR